MTRARSEPIFYVRVLAEGDSEPKQLDLTDRVLSFEYEDNEKKTDLLKLSINNWDLSNFDDPVWKHGNDLIVSWGYPGFFARERRCSVQTVKGGLTLTIEAHGEESKLAKVVRTRVFMDMKRSEVARQIGTEMGFYENQLVIDDTEDIIETITQSRETDHQFLRRMADLEGFEFYIDPDGFHFHECKLDQKPVRKLHWFTPPDVGDILSFNVETDLFGKPPAKAQAVKTEGRDDVEKKDVKGSASNKETKRDSLGPTPVFVADSNNTISEAAPSNKAAARAPSATTSVPADTQPTTATSDKAATREAAAKYRTNSQKSIELSMTIVGDPTLEAKSVVEVSGLGKRLSGKYYITQINHKLGSGYTCALKLKSDSSKGYAGAQNATAQKAQIDAQLEKERARYTTMVNSGSCTTAQLQAQRKVVEQLEAQQAKKAEESESKAKENTKTAENKTDNQLSVVTNSDGTISYKNTKGS